MITLHHLTFLYRYRNTGLMEKQKLNIKSAHYLSCLDIDAEQLWVLRFYKEHGVLPKIKQAKEIKETHPPISCFF